MDFKAYIIDTHSPLPAQDANLELPLYTQNPDRVAPLRSRRPGKPVLLVLAIAAGFLGYLGLRLYRLVPVENQIFANPAWSVNFAVATENGRYSGVSAYITKRGTNLIGAAVAATLCVGVVNMFSEIFAFGLHHYRKSHSCSTSSDSPDTSNT